MCPVVIWALVPSVYCVQSKLTSSPQPTVLVDFPDLSRNLLLRYIRHPHTGPALDTHPLQLQTGYLEPRSLATFHRSHST